MDLALQFWRAGAEAAPINEPHSVLYVYDIVTQYCQLVSDNDSHIWLLTRLWVELKNYKP